ncbi:MAG: STAS domain-containing protein [Puniceicoccaceae bacterium]
MTQDDAQFLVNPYDDPVIVTIKGKASFLNSSPMKELFDQLLSEGKARFIIDFKNCTGMDSTFLGILAGLGINLLKKDPPGSVVLCRLGERNRELIENLGLHRLLVLDTGESQSSVESAGDLEAVGNKGKLSQAENARLVLEAHENLVEVDASNRTKFQDVISFLKNQVEDN